MRRWTIFLLLAILAALLLAIAALAADPPTRPSKIKLTIINNSGYPDNQVYLTLVGKGFKNPGSPPPDDDDNHYYHLNMTVKTDPLDFPVCKTADNTLTVKKPDGTDYPNKFCQYWYTLDQIKDQNGYWFYFPAINGGRLWISYNKPVYFRMNDDYKGIVEPTTDLRANDPNPTTVFDKFEFTFDWADPWLHANTTCVDFFAIPTKFIEKSATQTWGPLGLNLDRAGVLRAMKDDPLFSSLNNPYRYNSPQDKVLFMTETSPYPMRHYFDAYINYCWSLYPDTEPTKPLTITGTTQVGGAFTAYGLVNASGDLVFTIKDIPGETHTIKKPVITDDTTFNIDTTPCSWDVFRCGGVFQPVGDPATAAGQRDGYIKTQVSAALNRSVMHLDYAKWGDSTKFYQQNGLTEAQYKTNNYSKILHQISIQHKSYAFAYDDASGWNAEIDQYANEIVLTIGGNSTPPLSLLLE